MVPAQQRLDRADPLSLHIDQRLVVENELVSLERMAHLVFERLARLQLLVHRGLEETHRAAAGLLGAVERDVGAFQQLVRIVAGRFGHRDADADPDVELLPVDAGTASR